jgi:hypothetical protein
LSVAQTFTLTVDEAVTQFTLLNPPSGSTAFTIKITQDSTGYSVGIDTFKIVVEQQYLFIGLVVVSYL